MNDSAENTTPPSGWKVTTLGEITIPSKDKIDPAEVPHSAYLGLEHVEADTRRIIGQGRASDVKSVKSTFNAGDVLYGKLRPYLNKVAQPDFDGICSTDFLVFKNSPALDDRFFVLFASQPAFVEFAHHASNGVSLPRVGWRALAKFPTALPPLAEQRRIAERLDEIGGRSSSIDGHFQAARSGLDRLRGALLSAACMGRLTEDWREQHPGAAGQSSVGPSDANQTSRLGLTSEAQLELLPSSWGLVRLGDMLDVTTGATPLRTNSAYYDDGTIPWVTSGAVNAGTVTSPTELITPRALEETNVKLFPPGTLLIAMYGEGQTRGRVAELAIEAGTNQALAAVLFTKETAPIRPYIRLFFEDSYQRLRSLSVGGVQPNLNLGMIRDTLLPLPPREEQAEIVLRASAALDAADRIATYLKQAAHTLDRVSASALTRAFRGELVPTEAELAAEEGRDYETAEELLARVKAKTRP